MKHIGLWIIWTLFIHTLRLSEREICFACANTFSEKQLLFELDVMAEGHAVAVKWKMDSLTILRDSEQVEEKKDSATSLAF